MHFRADTYTYQLLTHQQLTRISGHVLQVHFGSLTILFKKVFQCFCLRLLPITMLTQIGLDNNYAECGSVLVSHLLGKAHSCKRAALV